MPSINVNGRYCLFPYMGASASTTFRDSTYVNNICSVSTPNPLGFSLYLPYIPGLTQPDQGLTTLAPGSSYQIISRDAFATTKWSITYPGSDVDRLPAATNVKPFLFMIGLDKNSIVVPISSYVLGNNTPLSTIGQMLLTNGTYDRVLTFYAEQIQQGVYFGDTHFRPNSAYRLRNRVPFTFFAPLKSEMGDAYAWGNNSAGEYGMGHRYSHNSSLNGTLSAEQIYGVWDKIVISNLTNNITWQGQRINTFSLAALSSCGSSKALFVLGGNNYGQLGTSSSEQYYPVWTRVTGTWLDVEMGSYHMLAINTQGHLYATGRNDLGQLGLGSGVSSTNTLTLVDNTRNYVELAPSWSSTVVRDSNGAIYGCGDNTSGQLGINNRPSPVYTLTREGTNSTWTKVLACRGISSQGAFGCTVALRDNKLFGAGLTLLYGGPQMGSTSTFTQEALGLADVEDFYVNVKGTCIKRANQSYLFSAGIESLTKDLASLSASSNQFYFTKTYIPNNVSKLITNSNGIIGCIINNQVYKNDAASLSFTPKGFTAIDVYPDQSLTSTLFLLTNPNLHPSPTPTITPTKTPTPTPTPTVTPSSSSPATYPTFGDLSVGIYASENFSSNFDMFISNTIENMDSPLVFTWLFRGAPTTASAEKEGICADYEKTSNFNNIVGSAISYNQNGPSGRWYTRSLIKKTGNTSPWTATQLGAEFDPNQAYGPSHGTDSFFIGPPTTVNTQGVYKLSYTSTNKKRYEATSMDRGVTWTHKLRGPDFICNYQYPYAIGKLLYARSRKISNLSPFYTIGAAGVLTSGGLRASLYFYESFPETQGSVDIFQNFDGQPNGYDFKYDYYNIPTIVTMGQNVDNISNVKTLTIHRKTDPGSQTWISKNIFANIPNLCSPMFSYDGGSRINSRMLSIEFNPLEPDLIYIAYPISYTSYYPEQINVCCYNIKTETVLFNEAVVGADYSLVPNNQLFRIGRYTDMPTLYYNNNNNSLYLMFYALGNVYLQEFYRKTKRLGTNNWEALKPLISYPSGDTFAADKRFSFNWDIITKY